MQMLKCPCLVQTQARRRWGHLLVQASSMTVCCNFKAYTRYAETYLHVYKISSPCFWNQLPLSLRQPYSGTSSSIFDLPVPSSITSSSSDSPLCTSITPSLFHSRLKTVKPTFFHKCSFTSSSRTSFTDYCLDRSLSSELLGFCCYFLLLLVSMPCDRLSCPFRQLLSAS